MERLDTNMQQAVQEELQGFANLIKADAMANAPVLTGFLRSTIYAKMMAFWEFRIGAWCWYAPYQEFGTRFIPAQRFISKAIQARWPTIRAYLHRAIKFAIGRS